MDAITFDFFGSDYHIGHRNIINYCAPSRPFLDVAGEPDVGDMNYAIIENHNRVVAPDANVLLVGDMVMGKMVDHLPLISLLNGNLFLCPGNHDRCWTGNKKGLDRWTVEYEAVGFIILPPEFIITLSNGMRAKVCHFPYDGDHTVDMRYPQYRPSRGPDHDVLIHGHVHDLWKTRGPDMINVGIDVWDLAPISHATLVDSFNSLV